MKKLLLSSMMLAAGLFSVNAAETTITFSEQGYENQQSLDGTSLTVDDVTVSFAQNDANNPPAYYTSGTAVRFYSGCSFTVAVPSGSTMTAIDLVLASGSYNYADDDSGYTASTGTFTADHSSRTANWTGSAESVEITLNNAQNAAGKWPQLRIVSMTVTYTMGEQTQCSTPRFSLTEGTYYSAQYVPITCSTEGATIKYSINGDTEADYTEAIILAEAGTYTISAYAVKEGLDNSETATATYVIADPVEVGSISEFIMEGEGNSDAVYKWTFPVTVAYQIGNYTYVVDNAGSAIVIYGSLVPDYNVGDVIPAGVIGEFQNYRGLYEMTYPEESSFAAATENVGYTPAKMGAGEITADDMNKVIIIPEATYTEGDSKTISDDTGSITVYYQSSWNVTSGTSGTAYDLHCAVAVYNSAVQVYPIEFLEAGSGVNSIDAVSASAIRAISGGVSVVANGNVSVYNAAGQLVKSQNVNGAATIDLAKGFYIVRAGQDVQKVIVK